MPYSPSMSFVHVAVPKTGTTSLIRALRQLHKQHGDELQLAKGHVSQEFRELYGDRARFDRLPGRYKHLSARQICAYIGQDEFDRCFKFSIVRNPWARLVSRYSFTHIQNAPSPEQRRRKQTTRGFHALSFDQWMEKCWKKPRGRRSQLSKLIDDDGQMLMDYVGRLENFQQSFDHVCEQLGVPSNPLPRVNGTRPGHYSGYFNDNTRDMGWDIYQEDIEYFGYRFESI